MVLLCFVRLIPMLNSNQCDKRLSIIILNYYCFVVLIMERLTLRISKETLRVHMNLYKSQSNIFRQLIPIRMFHALLYLPHRSICIARIITGIEADKRFGIRSFLLDIGSFWNFVLPFYKNAVIQGHLNVYPITIFSITSFASCFCRLR